MGCIWLVVCVMPEFRQLDELEVALLSAEEFEAHIALASTRLQAYVKEDQAYFQMLAKYCAHPSRYNDDACTRCSVCHSPLALRNGKWVAIEIFRRV